MNVSLYRNDCFGEVLSHLVERFGTVHVRAFIVVVRSDLERSVAALFT